MLQASPGSRFIKRALGREKQTKSPLAWGFQISKFQNSCVWGTQMPQAKRCPCSLASAVKFGWNIWRVCFFWGKDGELSWIHVHFAASCRRSISIESQDVFAHFSEKWRFFLRRNWFSKSMFDHQNSWVGWFSRIKNNPSIPLFWVHWTADYLTANFQRPHAFSIAIWVGFSQQWSSWWLTCDGWAREMSVC